MDDLARLLALVESTDAEALKRTLKVAILGMADASNAAEPDRCVRETTTAMIRAMRPVGTDRHLAAV